MLRYQIAGILKLTSPLHVATPGQWVINLEDLRIRKGKADGSTNLNVTRTTNFPIALSEDEILSQGLHSGRESDTSTNTNIPDQSLFYLPVFPANDARGRLRRFAATEIFNILKANGQQISLGTYHGMTCGAVTGQPNKEGNFEMAVRSGSHPFLGLFGGGPRMVPSALQINTLWPVLASTISAGLVPLHYEDEKISLRPWKLTEAIFYRRIDDALVYTNGHAELTIRDYSSAVAEWIKELAAGKTDAGENVRSKKQLQTFAGVEYVIPGTRLYTEIKIDTERVELAGLGLLIHAVAAFATRQAIGGWARIGFGNFESKLDLITPEGNRFALLNKTEFGYEPNVEAEPVADALDAWATAAAKIKASDLEQLYALPPEKQKKAAQAA
jgi:CRISPR type IV-associated protein Csf2